MESKPKTNKTKGTTFYRSFRSPPKPSFQLPLWSFYFELPSILFPSLPLSLLPRLFKIKRKKKKESVPPLCFKEDSFPSVVLNIKASLKGRVKWGK